MTILFRLKFGVVCGLAIWSVVIIISYYLTRPLSPLTYIVARSPQPSLLQTIAVREPPPPLPISQNKTVLITNVAPVKHAEATEPQVTRTERSAPKVISPDVRGVPEAAVYVIIAAANDDLGGLIAAVNSIYTNAKVKVHFYLVCTKDDAAHLKTWIVSTRLHQMSYTLRDVGESKIRKVKIDFPDIFPEIEGKVIFLDCDVIVKGNLLELYKTPILLGDYGAFVTECPQPGDTGLRLKYASYIHTEHKKYSFKPDPNRCPFNTDVFVANVTQWRADNMTGRLHDWLNIHRQHPITPLKGMSEQIKAAMLIEMYGKTSPIDLPWNVHHLGSKTERRYSKQQMDTAKLIHWSGQWKPWQYGTAFADIWDRFYIPDPTGLFRPIRRRNH